MTGSWVKVGESWGLRGRRKRTRAAMFAARVDGGERYPDQLRGGLVFASSEERLEIAHGGDEVAFARRPW